MARLPCPWYISVALFLALGTATPRTSHLSVGVAEKPFLWPSALRRIHGNLRRYPGKVPIRPVLPFRRIRAYSAQEDIPVDIQTPPPAPGFDQFELHSGLNLGLTELGLVKPTPVQKAALPRAMTETSVALQSFTGSGKTAIFLLPILSRALDIVDDNRPEGNIVKFIIVSPSRELCMQIVRTAEILLGPDKKWMVQQLIGGANEMRQKRALKDKKPVVVIGTPGRLAAMIRGPLGVHHVEMVALDEADRLYESGFRDDMKFILFHSGKKVGDGGPQYILTSASLTPSSLRKMSDEWDLPRMCEIYARAPNKKATNEDRNRLGTSISPTIDHCFVSVDPKHKVDILRKTINALGAGKVMVFMNHARRLKDTLFRLRSRGIDAVILHSDMPKTARQNAISSFQNGQTRVLVATDAVARGIDLECDAVVNLEIPGGAEVYAHRAGRTGRMGREGVVVSLVAPYESEPFGRLCRSLGLDIEERVVYKGKISRRTWSEPAE